MQKTSVWRLQDAKAQFSALVDRALLGVPQHVTRRGKAAVVILSSEEYAALQSRPVYSETVSRSLTFVEHLLAIPKGADWPDEMGSQDLGSQDDGGLRPRVMDF